MSKRKIIIIALVVIAIITIVWSFILRSKAPKETIEKYDADIICYSKNTYSDDEEEQREYESYIYINVDKDNMVKDVIYQSIVEGYYLTDADMTFTNSFLDLYDKIDGIDAKAETIDGYGVTTIKYDYTKINLKDAINKMGSIVDDEHILKRVDTLPFDYDTFKKYEITEEYKCNQKK